MEFVPWTSFARIVTRYSGDARVSALPSTEHFRIMAYAQLTWRESLRDIEATLGANPTKLYAMGLCQAVRRSTLTSNAAFSGEVQRSQEALKIALLTIDSKRSANPSIFSVLKLRTLRLGQAAPAHQAIPGQQRKRREDASLVYHCHLRAHRDCQKGAATEILAIHLSTDFVGVGFRENPDVMRLADR